MFLAGRASAQKHKDFLRKSLPKGGPDQKSKKTCMFFNFFNIFNLFHFEDIENIENPMVQLSSGSLAMPTPVCSRAPPSPDALAFLADIDHEAEDEELEARPRAKTAAAAGVAETSHVVLHTARKRLHLWKPPAQTSVCGWWTCGTISAPCRFAVFDPERRTGVKRCRNCFVG